VGGLGHVNIKIIVGKNRASGRGNADGFILEVQFVNDLTDKLMDYGMAASGTIVEDRGL